MINLPGLNEALEDLMTTVLEPAAGGGGFCLRFWWAPSKVRKLSPSDPNAYENLSLLALTTLYGIELLEDNARELCVLNLYQLFYDDYYNFKPLDLKRKKNVSSSAKLIISANIVNGDFLSKKTPSGNPILFSEWRVVKRIEKTQIDYCRSHWALFWRYWERRN